MFNWDLVQVITYVRFMYRIEAAIIRVDYTDLLITGIDYISAFLQNTEI